MPQRSIFITILLTAFVTTGALCLFQSRVIQLMCPTLQKQAGSFGLSIAGYHALSFGNEKDNFLNGTRGGEDLLGGAGNDQIRGDGGDDFLYGEDGDDILEGGTGRDIVMGGSGNDTIIGMDSYELIDGGDGIDTLKVPYMCSKYTLQDYGNGTKTFRSGCGADLVTIKNVENFIVEPAPMQGPMPKPKFRHGVF